MNEKPVEPEMLPKLVQEFLRVNSYPSEKVERSRLVVVFGPPGVGKTELCRRMAARLPSAVHVQTNSVRHMLRHVENRSYQWGQNVRDIIRQAVKTYLASGYDVILDGGGTDAEDRQNVQAIAREAGGIAIFYAHIMTTLETALDRERAKYERAWQENIDTFADCRVNTTEKMLQNVKDRYPVHERLKTSEMPNLLAGIDNNGTLEDLDRIANELVTKLKAA